MNRLETLIHQSQSGDQQAKKILIEENSGLIWSIARRYTGRGTEMEDLYQLGCIGFLKAVDGFNLDFGTQFSTYAVPKISGEIRRFLRDDGAIKVSRGVKERAITIRTVRSRLLQVLGREPTISELSRQTGFTQEEIVTAELATANTESINQQTGDEGFSLEQVLSNTDSEDAILERISLKDAVSHLPEREKLVVHLRYFHALTQDKCAKIIDISQVQVSRIEKKALQHLREMLK